MTRFQFLIGVDGSLLSCILPADRGLSSYAYTRALLGAVASLVEVVESCTLAIGENRTRGTPGNFDCVWLFVHALYLVVASVPSEACDLSGARLP